jgi:hypothetical protein
MAPALDWGVEATSGEPKKCGVKLCSELCSIRATVPQMAAVDLLYVLDLSLSEGLAVLGSSACSRNSRLWYRASSPVRTA